MKFLRLAVVALPVVLFVVARESAYLPDTPDGRTAVKTYEAHGVFRRIDPETGDARISHEAIPGYMEAMTMSFAVHDDAGLKILRPGDTLDFRLCISGTQAWVDHLRRTGATIVPTLAKATPTQEELQPGDPAPDIAFVDSAGQVRHLHDFSGQVLALTFIYTRCPLPTYCPRMNQNFQYAQDLLGQLGQPDGWHFVSPSFDAAHDTPTVLAEHAQRWHADAHTWTFASAGEEAVNALGGRLGLEVRRANGRLDHNLRTVVIDGSGRVRHVFSGNRWTPQELAAEVRTALRHQR